MKVNALQYNVALPESLPSKIAALQRRKMFAVFAGLTAGDGDGTIIDVGATSDRSYSHSNYLEAWYPQKSRITAVGLDDASFLEREYPGVRFVQANGLDLPFEDASFDFAHSSAVIEHVGSRAMQIQFLRELWRVARRGIFVTTPNRWFPIEFHTVLPLLHWLPAPLFRRLLPGLGRAFFASEEHLNLLSSRTLADAARHAGLGGIRILSVSLFGWPSNLLLSAVKP